jgi:serine/threonine-protein kinase HipA
LSGASFATRRFDRNDDGTRVHIEDFCQIFRMQPTRKYEDRNFADIAKIVDRFIGSKALDDFIKRLVFNIAIGNNDMHLKNWSVVYRDPTAPSLAPAYDFLSTKAQVRDNRTGLAIGNAREFNAVTAAQLAYLAIRAEVSPKLVAHAANEMIDNFVDVWQKHRQNTPDFVAKVIDGQLEQVPLLHERLNRRRTLTLPELPAM